MSRSTDSNYLNYKLLSERIHSNMKKLIILLFFGSFIFLGSTAFKDKELKKVTLRMIKLPDCTAEQLYTPPANFNCVQSGEVENIKNGSYYTHVVHWTCPGIGNFNSTCTDQKATAPTPPQQ